MTKLTRRSLLRNSLGLVTAGDIIPSVYRQRGVENRDGVVGSGFR
jgi:hypothetical protein